MTDFGGLPDHIQVMVAGTVVVVASSWGVIKFIKPLIDQLAPKPQTSPQTTDAVVLSASFADSKAMSDLTHSIDRMCEAQEKGNIINTMLIEVITRLIHKP